jgi:glycerate 2-kinase
MRVLVAPDKFRGTLTARQAAEAIETGWKRERPADRLDLAPMADGGEGTMDALVGALNGTVVAASVAGPLGDPVEAAFGLVSTTEGTLGVVEMARASGLALLDPKRRDPSRASTRGTGELMAAAVAAGARRLLVCLGGSATNDGGTGMAAALGVRFLDGQGLDLAPGGSALAGLARIDATTVSPVWASVRVTGACDVDNPLTGPTGASAVYGPQKWADPEAVWQLDRALGHLAAVVYRDLGIALKDEPGAGAAGGLGFGLLAFCGGRLRRGVDVVMDAVGMRERVEASDLVITGEGSLDAQSLRGKVPAGVLGAAEGAGVPAAVLCGRSSIDVPGVLVLTLVERVGEAAALEDARRSLEQVAQDLAGRAETLVAGPGERPGDAR